MKKWVTCCVAVGSVVAVGIDVRHGRRGGLSSSNGAMAQLVAHLLCKQGVTGSSPVSSTTKGPASAGPFCYARGRSDEALRGLRVKMCVWLGVSRGLDLAFLNAD